MSRLGRYRHGLVALTLTVLASACASTPLSRAQAADQAHDFDLAVAEYTRAVREHPESRDAALGLERAKLRASNEHLAAGRRLESQGRIQDSVADYQLAAELNPTNADAAEALRRVRIALRAELAASTERTPLESLLARSTDLAPAGYEVPNVTLPTQITTGQQATSRTVYLLLGRLANLSVTFDAQVRDVPAGVSLQAGSTLRQALDAVAAATGTFYQVLGPSAILVIPDTPVKRREYADEVVRQFTVQNADLKETMDALRVVTDARYISPITGTNTLLVRDTAARVQVIGRFLAAFDKAKPEIIVNVEVLEVDRSKLLDYGLQLASPGSTGIDGAVDINQAGGITLETLRNLTQANVLLTNIPALYYRLLKTDARTRTLANPHIRMTDGTQASANFGQEVPVPRLTITPIAQGGVAIQPQTQFDYRTIGVNIGITPRTHPDDEITLALNIELSSLGPPGFDGLPTFGRRNVTTAIRLKDGETNILAGLIREDERTEHQSIPGLGDVPVLGSIFGRTRTEAQQTDVVVMLTPHIVRVLDLSEDDLRPLRLPREGGAAVLEPTSLPPAPPLIIPPRPNVPAGANPANTPGQ